MQRTGMAMDYLHIVFNGTGCLHGCAK